MRDMSYRNDPMEYVTYRRKLGVGERVLIYIWELNSMQNFFAICA